jgi:hypothetical protein
VFLAPHLLQMGGWVCLCERGEGGSSREVTSTVKATAEWSCISCLPPPCLLVLCFNSPVLLPLQAVQGRGQAV